MLPFYLLKDLPHLGHFQQGTSSTLVESSDTVTTGPLTKSGMPDHPFWRAIPSFIRMWQRLHFGLFDFMAVTVTGFSAPVEFPLQPNKDAGTKDGK